MRIAFLLLAVLVYMSEEFGLEVVLGAFLAGAMVSLLDRERRRARVSGLQDKLDGIGFGVFIPIFFVVSGVRLDLDALFSSLGTVVLVPLTVIALLLVRGASRAASTGAFCRAARRSRPACCRPPRFRSSWPPPRSASSSASSIRPRPRGSSPAV